MKDYCSTTALLKDTSLNYFNYINYFHELIFAGFSTAQIMVKNGVRQQAADKYLKMAKDRPNLAVRPKATVTKVRQKLI